MLEAASRGSCRCPMLPVQKRPTLDPESASMRFATGVHMLMVRGWIEDKRQDGALWAAPFEGPSQRHAATARQSLDALGVEIPCFETLTERQRAAEALEGASLARVLSPTQDLLGSIFSQVADLPGVAPVMQTAHAREQLGALGRALGATVYLLDALEDVRVDLVRGDYNYAVTTTSRGTRVVVLARVEAMVDALFGSIDVVQRCVQELPWRRNQSLLAEVTRGRLPELARIQGHTAETFAREHGERERRVSWLLAWWVWLSGVLSSHLRSLRPTTPAPEPAKLAYALAQGQGPYGGGEDPNLPQHHQNRHPGFYEPDHAEIQRRRDDDCCLQALCCCEGADCLCCVCDCVSDCT